MFAGILEQGQGPAFLGWNDPVAAAGSVTRALRVRPAWAFPGPGEIDHARETLIALSVAGSDQHIAERVPVEALEPGPSPRLSGVDPQHVQRLAAMRGPLPPILVHRGTMRVIDGAHRLEAARRIGQKAIEVNFFDGTDDEAFVAGVAANIAHGLPLTLADRQAAAARLLTSRPDRSDRWIAAVAGLAVSTVGAIRGRLQPAGDRVGDGITARIGRDGRVRPVSSAGGRELARQVITEQPDASLRQIARMAGISVGTARDVRERMKRGDDPVPVRQAGRYAQTLAAGHPSGQASKQPARSAQETPDCQALLRKLTPDPSLRYSETGRALLRWLHTVASGPSTGPDFIDGLPSHCWYPVTQILRQCAAQWLQTAAQLDARLRPQQPVSVQLPRSDSCTSPNPQNHMAHNHEEKVR